VDKGFRALDWELPPFCLLFGLVLTLARRLSFKKKSFSTFAKTAPILIVRWRSREFGSSFFLVWTERPGFLPFSKKNFRFKNLD